MIEFKSKINDDMELLSIKLHKDELYIDPSFIKYIQGHVSFVASMTKKQTLLKYYTHGARSLIPKIKGSGVIELKPILGSFNILDLNKKENSNLICTKDAFVASEPNVILTPKVDFNLNKILSSLPLRNYLLTGNGKAILYSNGPIQAIEVNNEKFSIYAGQVIAYSEQLSITQSVSKDGYWGLSKNSKTVLDFFGTGIIYIVIHPNKLYLLANNSNKFK